MSSVVARPAHVDPRRVVDFDYLAPHGHEVDVHQAWQALHAPGVPDIVWTPHYGGHWIATRAADIVRDAGGRRPLLDVLGHHPGVGAGVSHRAAGDGSARAHAVSRVAVAALRNRGR